jgi:lysophospholipase L1-like esterase
MKNYQLLAALCVVLFCGTANAQGLLIGTFTAVGNVNGITLSVSSPLKGGTGSGYSYVIYRGTTPTVSPTDATPLATVSALPYTDSSAAPSTIYFYKIVGKDNGANIVYAAPAALDGIYTSTSTDLSAAAQRPAQAINIVYGGDSITYGANLDDPADDAPPVKASEDLRGMSGIREVNFSNQGHGGHSTTDFLPSSGDDFKGMEQAAKSLQNANATGQLIFSLMLGTNDSASGTHTGDRTPEQVKANFETIINQLLADFPDSKVFVHYAPLYSPNTHNGTFYEEKGLARLISYFPAIDEVVAAENKSHRGHVFSGDKTAPAHFAAVYATELTPEHGQNGTFYLHPNKAGAADLGRLWAEAIYQGLYGTHQK